MVRLLISLLAIVSLPSWSSANDRELLIVIGAEGSLEFAVPFAEAATQWAQAAESAGDVKTTLVDNRKRLEAEIQAQIAAQPEELWIVLIGHGTFDGRTAKFNLEGEDVSAAELGEWFKDWIGGELVFINTASASAPFIPALKGPNRTVITATKSGAEVNITRFGKYLAKSLHSNLADANKDGQISVLEAFLLASSHTAEFYEKERRLATEQALIDDNGDGKGIRADWFEGLRVAKKVGEEAVPDGQRSRNIHLVRGEMDRQLSAEARERRNELELMAEELRENRADLGDEAYYDQLEEIFVEIAKIYGEVGS